MLFFCISGMSQSMKVKINVWDSLLYVDKDDINLLRWAEMFYRHFIPELGRLTCYHTWTTTGQHRGGDGQDPHCVVRQLEDTDTLFAEIPKIERKELNSNARIYHQHWGRETHSLGRAWRTVTSMSVPLSWIKSRLIIALKYKRLIPARQWLLGCEIIWLSPDAYFYFWSQYLSILRKFCFPILCIIDRIMNHSDLS